jgi:hypothetical protein
LKMDLNRALWLFLSYAYGVSLTLCLMWVGINLYLFSNQVLIKFDQLKC